MSVGDLLVDEYACEIVDVGDHQQPAQHQQYPLNDESLRHEPYTERYAHDDRTHHRDETAYGRHEGPEDDVGHSECPVDERRYEPLSKHHKWYTHGVAVNNGGHLLEQYFPAVTAEGHVLAHTGLQLMGMGEHKIEQDDSHQYVGGKAVRGIDNRVGDLCHHACRRTHQIGRDQIESYEFVDAGHGILGHVGHARHVDVVELLGYHFEQQVAQPNEHHADGAHDHQRRKPPWPPVFVGHGEYHPAEHDVESDRSEERAGAV